MAQRQRLSTRCGWASHVRFVSNMNQSLGSMFNRYWPAAFMVVAFTLHNADHAIRGLADTTDSVVWSGTLLMVLVSIAITLKVVDHPLAPEWAIMVGAATAFGVASSHFLPKWSFLSDPLADRNVGFASWGVASLEIIAGVVFAISGIRDRSKRLELERLDAAS